MTIEEFYKKIINQLQEIYTQSEATYIADWILEKRINFKKKDILYKKEELIDEKIENKIDEDIKRLLQHEPIQYILQEAWFYKMNFKVNENVLIPRPETEELIEWVLNDHIPMSGDHSLSTNIIDIGTGGGCIAISLKKNLPVVLVTAIDVSENALKTAKENSVTNNTNIYFKEIDFLNEIEWGKLGLYDIIVSNPPYIPFSEKEKLDRNVVGYEPGNALFVPDDDPLVFYKKIILFAKQHLTENGKIFVEIHENFAEEVLKLFSTSFTSVEVRKDMYGKNRMVKAHNKIANN